MPLAAAPTITAGSAGNVLSSQTLAASANVTSSTFYVGASGQSGSQGSTSTGSALGGLLQIWDTYQTAVAATNGCQVSIYRSADGTHFDAIPMPGGYFVITTSSTAAQLASIELPPGIYQLNLKNLDGTNAITVEATLATVA
jgi:hypothetical protein